ncbi:hypothetical protein F2P45_07975 [Massilia sp. CCM 8733]|uniref:OmpA-like domain-containing protein n=1 Tax=Massilia mucilaginosa TaxID=2609282 RepID=A0ABX0NQ48_9BURK|nr:hypothetical protein [Massilia mucilaginosa]NHZ88957.1 hypothetical protein [Massilia mucilaginosa]
MRGHHAGFIGLVCCLLAGCSTLSKSIEQRVEVSEQCRLATSQLPGGLKPPDAIASVTLGNLGSCRIGQQDQPLAVCSLKQIVARSGFKHNPTLKASAASVEEFDKAEMAFREQLAKMVGQANELDLIYQKHFVNATRSTYSGNTALLNEIRNVALNGDTDRQALREALDRLSRATSSLGTALELDARAELAAWDHNVRAQLDQMERLFSGDLRLVLHDSLRDQVVTHVARRSLELLHGSLKAADAVLNRLDDKAYGAVSIGYLAFGPNIQSAVNDAYGKLEEVYAKRQKDAGASPKDSISNTQIFMEELRRAACDRLVKGTQFSMLSELVDTMLILKVTDKYPLLPPVNSPWRAGNGAETPKQAGSLDVDGEEGYLMFANAPASASFGETPRTTPFSVYVVSEWTARQHLLKQKMTARLMAQADKGVVGNFPGIETLDESAVERLADAVTAKTVDDAVRLEPGMLTATNVSGSPYLTSALNVTNASHAVSMASIALNLNISISNTNTFAATNQNIVAPMIYLPSAGASESVPALCDAVQALSAGTTCIRDGAGYSVIFDGPFGSDSCQAGDLEPALSAIGQRLATYRDLHGVRFDATVDGFSSLPKAKLAYCPVVKRAPVNCRFPNKLLESIAIKGCSPAMRDRNGILSAARARNAAALIEASGKGAVIVKALSARGIEIASLRGENARPAADQTIILRLQPIPAPR